MQRLEDHADIVICSAQLIERFEKHARQSRDRRPRYYIQIRPVLYALAAVIIWPNAKQMFDYHFDHSFWRALPDLFSRNNFSEAL